MTNNPTIDGVSREKFEKEVQRKAERFQPDFRRYGDSPEAEYKDSTMQWAYELCQSLWRDAPAVEPTNELREHCKQCAEVVKNWPEWKRDCLGGATAVERQEPAPIREFSWTPEINEFYEELSNGGKLPQCALCHIRHLQDGIRKHWKVVCDQRSENTDQQSTIARLEARIAELESGRGVVSAYRVQHPDGYWCTWGSGPVSDGDEQDLAEGVITGIELAYAAPPEPVAVVLPSYKDSDLRSPTYGYSRGWNACLDATAALNGPAK